ncbi:hypothetical protein HGM15179_015364 [Zosterops borbonicus]|uniref:Small integral membrane protein 41 n=1 Tax=Zosterops borbonicus TaxID=364589 RepID=A0A8K1G4U0_9PASS|nr:hypothetical protein HGM15179_015364 [Zosterops borbonicus]
MNTTREDTGVSEAAQIAVVLVLCLAVTFAILFLGCNLLLQAESLAAPTAQGERRLSEPEGGTEGTISEGVRQHWGLVWVDVTEFT